MPDEHPADAVLAALNTKLRRDILRLIETKGPIGPKGLAALVGLPVPNVSYHVAQLAKAGLIELDSTAPARGAVAHFYRRSKKNAGRVDTIIKAADGIR